MATKLAMPKLGLSMTQAKIIESLKNEKHAVEKRDGIPNIKTKKIVYTIEPPAAGFFLKIQARVAMSFRLAPPQPKMTRQESRSRKPFKRELPKEMKLERRPLQNNKLLMLKNQARVPESRFLPLQKLWLRSGKPITLPL